MMHFMSQDKKNNRKRLSKRIIALALILILAMSLSGCKQSEVPNERKVSVICTIFPLYDWVRQILGNTADEMDVTFLLSNMIDLHNYQPTVDDIVKISTCDMFVYVGGESDGWVDNALKGVTNRDMIVINLLDALGEAAKAEVIVEGMEDEDHDHEEESGNDESEEDGYDEHIWLSLRNAQLFCSVIADALSLLDAGNTETYQNNLAAYIEQLSALDAEYQSVINAAPIKTLLFGDRFPFRYLVDDYGLNYYAAFAGCSAETEASFETIVFLAGKADELGLKCVVVTESSDKKIAETIIRESGSANQQILVLDSMQSAEISDVANNATYISIMESNLVALKEALN